MANVLVRGTRKGTHAPAHRLIPFAAKKLASCKSRARTTAKVTGSNEFIDEQKKPPRKPRTIFAKCVNALTKNYQVPQANCNFLEFDSNLFV